MEFLGKQSSWHPKNSHFVQQIIENFLYRTFSIVGAIWWAFLVKTNILTPCYNSERCIYLIFHQILLSFNLNLVFFKLLTTILQVPPERCCDIILPFSESASELWRNICYPGFIFLLFFPLHSPINSLQGDLFEIVAEGWESGQCRGATSHGSLSHLLLQFRCAFSTDLIYHFHLMIISLHFQCHGLKGDITLSSLWVTQFAW